MNKLRKKKVKQQPVNTLFDRCNYFFESNNKIIVSIIFITAALFSFLMFDPKINMMGDDAEYILYSYKFAKNFDFPGYRGPFYPILISPFIGIFGIKITLLKLLSSLMMLGSLWFMYKALYKRVPLSITFLCLILLSINGSYLFYSSAVLSEPLFLLLQSLLIYFFCKYFIDENNAGLNLTIRRFLGLSFLILLLSLTRSVGYAAVGVIGVYFLINKQWKNAGLSVVCSGFVFGLFGILKKILWPASGSAYNLSDFFTKDMYNPDKGMEDFGGIVVRLFTNVNNYMSKYVAEFLGLRLTITTSSIVLTLIICGLFFWGVWMTFRKNKPLFFIALYTLGFCAANFIILHATWQQQRFIIVFYPLILLIILSAVYYTVENKRGLHFIYFIACSILFFGTLYHTITYTQKNFPALRKALAGDALYGLTPDWKNYIEMSQWTVKNVPPDDKIAVRKPGTSTIYTGKDFYGIYAVPSVPKDSLINWKATADNIILVLDISSKYPVELAGYLKYIATGNLKISNKDTQLNAIYEMNPLVFPGIQAQLEQAGFTYTTDYTNYLEELVKTPTNLVYSPEELFENLKKNNVKYMILASLRMNPNQNTGNIINTLHRYVQLMNYRYPNMFQQLHTIGTTEPSYLVKLNY